MSAEIHFLGWDEPVTTKAVNYLIPKAPGVGPVDLSDLLVVVPTRQAGRRLREALARSGSGLLPPRVETPSFFLQAVRVTPEVAPEAAVRMAWIHVLMHAKLDAFPGLFPAAEPFQDFDWALGMADLLHGLRHQLVDGGCLLRDLVERHKGRLPESERWWDLHRLEQRYLERLGKLGFTDPCSAMVQAAETFELPEGIERIIVAAVPDPARLMLRALEQATVPVQVLVHAPGEHGADFDSWGRPRPDAWAVNDIPVPEPDRNLCLAGSPLAQGRRVLQLLQEEGHAPGDVAVGVPDAEVTPFVMANLREHGVHTFDPAGKPLSTHPLFQLLEAFCDLVQEESYGAASRFLRHADVLALLQEESRVSAHDVLEELDRFQNDFLPLSWGDVARRFPSDRSPALDKAVAFARERLAAFQGAPVDQAVRDLMQRVYAQHTLVPHRPEDEAFRKVVAQLVGALEEFAPHVVKAMRLSPGEALRLLVRRLSQEQYYPDKPDAGLDLEGWLELPWNDARFLIVTGMNEGRVPDGRIDDMFLPDSLRERFGLPQDRDRLARDAYLMRALVESRASGGRVCFLVGKTGAAGDPLKPSRLLFRCAEEELPERARRLFGDAEELPENVPATVSFPLDVEAPLEGEVDALVVEVMHVTSFRAYLACPFRFYLGRVLRMEPLSDDKTEMDALDFGTLVHRSLEHMARDEDIRVSADADRVADFLCGVLEETVGKRFGTPLPLPVAVQVESARQRLRAAARAQVALVEAGWEILHAERKFETTLAGVPVHGKVDRIDRHRHTGRLRVYDYKSSDKATSPRETHLAAPGAGPAYAELTEKGKSRRWIDLQLPLYRILLEADGLADGAVEVGYFNLPKAVNETGVYAWDGFTEEMYASARACTEGVLADIKARKFWPPVERVRYDDFEDLFHGSVPEAFRVERLATLAGEGS